MTNKLLNRECLIFLVVEIKVKDGVVDECRRGKNPRRWRLLRRNKWKLKPTVCILKLFAARLVFLVTGAMQTPDSGYLFCNVVIVDLGIVNIRQSPERSPFLCTVFFYL